MKLAIAATCLLALLTGCSKRDMTIDCRPKPPTATIYYTGRMVFYRPILLTSGQSLLCAPGSVIYSHDDQDAIMGSGVRAVIQAEGHDISVYGCTIQILSGDPEPYKGAS